MALFSSNPVFILEVARVVKLASLCGESNKTYPFSASGTSLA
jgi:hypothetical protein